MTDLLSVSEAQQRILQYFQPTPIEEAALEAAAGRVLAREIAATTDLPPFSNSSMDGFAVIAEDTQPATPDIPVILDLVADIPAGKLPSVEIKPGQAARIMTGGQMPAGADAVIPVEKTDHFHKNDQEHLSEKVQVFSPVKSGEFVRLRGQSVKKGEIILHPGRQLTPQDIGLLASFGIAHAPLYRRPVISLLTTGDELVSPGRSLEPGKIYDSNSYMLAALIKQFGGCTLRLGIVPDQPSAIRKHLDHAVSENVDLIISSAGMSVGVYDYVKNVVEESGRLDFWRVKMRPGKPLAFGWYKNIPFIGLPGNPVSAFVGFMVFIVPVIQRMAGLQETRWPRVQVHLNQAVETDGRETYFRVHVRRQGNQLIAGLQDHQGSDNLVGLTRANALLIIPSGVKSLPAGSEATAWLLDREQIGK